MAVEYKYWCGALDRPLQYFNLTGEPIMHYSFVGYIYAKNKRQAKERAFREANSCKNVWPNGVPYKDIKVSLTDLSSRPIPSADFNCKGKYD